MSCRTRTWVLEIRWPSQSGFMPRKLWANRALLKKKTATVSKIGSGRKERLKEMEAEGCVSFNGGFNSVAAAISRQLLPPGNASHSSASTNRIRPGSTAPPWHYSRTCPHFDLFSPQRSPNSRIFNLPTGPLVYFEQIPNLLQLRAPIMIIYKVRYSKGTAPPSRRSHSLLKPSVGYPR